MLTRVGAAALVLCVSTALAAEGPESAFTRGVAAYRAGSYDEALSLFDDALRRNPDDPPALYYRGLSRARIGQYAEAIADLRGAEPSLPDVPIAADIGVAYYYDGEPAQAVPWLKKATSNPVSAPGAHLLLGIIAYDAGDTAAAQTYLVQAEASGGPQVKGTAAYYLGLVAAAGARPADARSAFQLARAAGEPAVAEAAALYLRRLPASDDGGLAPSPGDVLPYAVRTSASFQYDSNVLIADIPFDQRQALPFDPKKNDGRFVVGLGATYYALADDEALLQFSYDFYQSLLFSVDRLDLQGHTASALFEYGDDLLVPGILGTYSLYLTDGTSTYLSEATAMPYLVVQEAGFGQSEIHYRFTGSNYIGAPFNPFRDGYNNAVGARQVFFLGSPDRRLDVGYQWDETTTEGSGPGSRDFDETSNGVDVGVHWYLREIAWLEARYFYRNDDYLHGNSRAAPMAVRLPDGSLGVSRLRRRDDRQEVMVLVTRDITDGIYASLGYLFTDNASNIQVFEYSRHIVSATVGFNF